MRAKTIGVALLLGIVALPRSATRPNILLITLDTVRADRMGFLGSTRGLTPQLDALARESIVFTRAYSQAPITTVSHATTCESIRVKNEFTVPLLAAHRTGWQ